VTPKTLHPHNEDAERRLLAGLLREPLLVTEACIRHGVKEEHLYFHPHRLVWGAAWSLIHSGGVPDLVGVWQTLVCRGQQRELDPRAPALWLADLYDEDPTGAWCDWSCELIREAATRRDLIHRANEVLRDAYDRVREPEFYRRQLASLAR
jgi:replicative DNA helicase